MADRVHALRTGHSARSLRPPPPACSSSLAKGKTPIRTNPQFEAYHNPWRIPESEPAGFWNSCFRSRSTDSKAQSTCDEYDEAYRGYGEYEDETGKASGFRWVKPLILVLIVALLMAFVALVPPPSYGSRERDTPDVDFTVQAEQDSAHVEIWDVAEELPELEDMQTEAQRILRIVHRPR